MAEKKKNAKIWHEMSVDMIRDAITKGQKTVLVPVGCTEQHGYHLTTATDCISAQEISIRAAEKTGCFVAPLIPYSFSGGLLPGTINIHPETLANLMADITDSLFQQGLENVLFTLGHGGTENFYGIMNFKQLYFHKRPWLRGKLLAIVPLNRLARRPPPPAGLRDFHAGYTETSAMMELAPESVRLEKRTLDKEPIASKMREDPDYYQHIEKPFDHPFVAPYISQKKEVKVGVMGDPFQADAAMGKKRASDKVKELAEFIRAVGKRKKGSYTLAKNEFVSPCM
ncbi:MAG: creatininase family protein [Candidatus Ratteibacteria bacterium]|jgi:creatinine amidohydrolase